MTDFILLLVYPSLRAGELGGERLRREVSSASMELLLSRQDHNQFSLAASKAFKCVKPHQPMTPCNVVLFVTVEMLTSKDILKSLTVEQQNAKTINNEDSQIVTRHVA